MYFRLYICACVFAYTLVQVCACERSDIFWACVFAYIFVKECVYLYFSARVCSLTYLCMCVFAYIFVHVCVCFYFYAMYVRLHFF